MKNKFTLTIAIILNCLNGYAQTLTNTTWEVFDPSGSPSGYFHFESDTLSVSSDNITYTDISIYQEIGNNFTIVDLQPGTGGSCPASDTGTYTFSIQNDTLKFIEVFEPCFVRAQVVSVFHWIRVSTGIEETNLFSGIKIYPNPAGDFVSIQSKAVGFDLAYTVSDHLGRPVLNGKLNNEITNIDIAKLSSGFYFFRFGDSSSVLKLIKE